MATVGAVAGALRVAWVTLWKTTPREFDDGGDNHYYLACGR